MNVNGKTIILTGAAGGLGSEIAHTLCASGAILFLLDTDIKKGRTLETHLIQKGLKGCFFAINLTCEEEWIKVVSDIYQQSGGVDILINNAGINIRKPIEKMALSEWNTMMSVNVGSIFLGIKHILPLMRKQGKGLILNTSSVCGLIGHKYTPEAYTASKGAVTLLTKSIAARYGKDGVRCNSIHPSTVDTPLVQEMFKDPAKKAERLGEVPLNRLCTAQDVAQTVLFLCSDEASFLNGVSLPVDGGVTCY